MKAQVVIFAIIWAAGSASICVDLEPDTCPGLAEEGYCTDPDNREAMQENCPKSCKICQTQPDCNDRNPACLTYSKAGYCSSRSTYRSWMEGNCAAACGFCTKSDSCKDISADCSAHKNSGYCSPGNVYRKWMESNCVSTCGLCGPSPITPLSTARTTSRTTTQPTTQPTTQLTTFTTKKECADLAKHVTACPQYKNAGYCTPSNQYRRFMEANCAATCGFCVPPVTPSSRPVSTQRTTKASTKGDCEDLQPTATCIASAQRGGCNSPGQKEMMQRDCRKSCGLCPSPMAATTPPVATTTGTTTKRTTTTPVFSKYENTCGRPKRFTKIIGGEDAKPNTWNWQVGIYRDTEMHCGGTLITPEWVLTAAHCLRRYEIAFDVLRVVLGDHDRSVQEGPEQRFEVSKVIVHSQYSKSKSFYLENDIALLKLNRPAKLNMEVNLACMPKMEHVPAPGMECFVTGWGRNNLSGEDNPILQQAVLPIVSWEQCKSRNLRISSTNTIDLPDSVLCAGYGPDNITSGCRGDSGGPLVCRPVGTSQFKVQGVVSWGSGRCLGSDAYTVFTKVASFRQWIEENIV